MNIDMIRHLLSAYYDGTATGADLNALKRYFVEAHDIPEDLRIDATIFRAMAAADHADVPADLEQKIIDSTIGSQRRRRFLNWRVAVSAAASLALLISLGFAFLPEKSAHLPDDNALLASSILPEEEVVIQTAAIEQENIAEPKVRVARQQAPRARRNTGNYREITDSAQVVEITSRVLAKLDASFSKLENGVKKTEIAAAIIANPFDLNKLSDELSK